MRKFPDDVRKRMWITLDVTKHAPADIIIRRLPTLRERMDGEKGHNTSRFVENILSELAGEPIYLNKYIDLILDSGLVKYDRDPVSGESVPDAFLLTQEGKYFGRPAANLAINFMVDNNIALTDIFGYGMKYPKSTYRRFKIIEELITLNKAPVRKTHLAYDTGGNVSRDLEVLAEAGLVECNIESVEELVIKKSRYKGNKNDLENLGEIEREVAYSLIRGNRSVALISRDTGLRVPTIVNIMRELHKKDLIKATDTFMNYRKFEVSLKENGKSFWENFLRPLENINLVEETEWGNDMLYNFIEKERKAMEIYFSSIKKHKYRPVSSETLSD